MKVLKCYVLIATIFWNLIAFKGGHFIREDIIFKELRYLLKSHFKIKGFKPVVVAEPPHCSVVVVLLTVGPSLHLGDWHQTSGSPAVIPGAPPRLGAS